MGLSADKPKKKSDLGRQSEQRQCSVFMLLDFTGVFLFSVCHACCIRAKRTGFLNVTVI